MDHYGKFSVLDVLGTGGMGLVYRAQHPDGTQVALKVVRPTGVDFEREMRTLRREVNAVAALNHRGIVQIVDVGEVVVDGESQTWFAMELADGGTLESTKIRSFAELSRLLFDVLDALAYAHARGIVHRDLKPSNILLARDREGWRSVLTDFGIAHVAQDGVTPLEEVTRVTAGTPAYMAPEQFHGDWRNYGPWTDLYALGCLAYELTTGAPPFRATSALGVALAHIGEPLPKMVPQFAVPPEFEAWVTRLAAKDLNLRYRSAADAAWGLVNVINDNPLYSPSAQIVGISVKSVQLSATLESYATQLVDRVAFGELLLSDSAGAVAPKPILRPPVPYEVVEPTETVDRAMFGVGLALFGLRQTPFVGRVEEREVMWARLRRACHGTLQTISISGEVGSGRSRLMDWLCMRASEVGAAQAIHVQHSETGSGSHGLAPAFVNALGVQKLKGRELVHGLQRALEGLAGRLGRDLGGLEDRAMELAQLLVPEPIPGYPHVVFENPRQRYILLTWLLQLMAQDRPVILTVDDAHWGWDALGFVMHLAKESPKMALIAVVSSDELIRCPVTRERHTSLQTWQDTVSIRLEPLNHREQESLVRALAPLDRAATNRIVHATTGHPGRVAHVIGDLIRNGSLVPGPSGYGLAEAVQLTHEINTYWTRLLMRLQEAFGAGHWDSVQRILESLAALGGGSLAQLQPVLEGLGVQFDAERVLETAREIGILREDEHVWSFADRDFELEVRRESETVRRWPIIQRICARCVPPEGSNGMPASERRYVHLDMGGFEKEAVVELEAALDEHLQQSSYDRAGALAQELERRLAALGAAPDDPRRLHALTVRLDVMRFTGRISDALETAQGMEQRLATCPDPHARADGLRSMANVAYISGDYDRAMLLFQRAFSLAAGNDLLLAKLHHGAGWFLSNTRDEGAAEESYKKSAECARRIGSDRDVAWALHGLAELKARRQNLEGKALALEAREIFARVGSRTGWSLCVQLLAEFARQEGHIEEAETLYLRAAQTLNHVGSIVEALVRGRLAVLYYSQGNQRRALEEAELGREAIGAGMSLPARLYVDLVLMRLHPSTKVRNEHRDIARELIERTGFHHPDFELFGEF